MQTISTDADSWIAKSFVVLRSRCLLKPIISRLVFVDNVFQIIFADIVLNQVVKNFCLIPIV